MEPQMLFFSLTVTPYIHIFVFLNTISVHNLILMYFTNVNFVKNLYFVPCHSTEKRSLAGTVRQLHFFL